MEIKAVNYAASCANSDLQYCFFMSSLSVLMRNSQEVHIFSRTL